MVFSFPIGNKNPAAEDNPSFLTGPSIKLLFDKLSTTTSQPASSFNIFAWDVFIFPVTRFNLYGNDHGKISKAPAILFIFTEMLFFIVPLQSICWVVLPASTNSGDAVPVSYIRLVSDCVKCLLITVTSDRVELPRFIVLPC